MAPLATALPTELLVSCLCFSSEGTIGLRPLMIQVNTPARPITHRTDTAHNHRFAPKESRPTGCTIGWATLLPHCRSSEQLRPDSVFRFNLLSSAPYLGRTLVPQIAVFFHRRADDLFHLRGQLRLSWRGETGSRLRIASKITAEVSPSNGATASCHLV